MANRKLRIAAALLIIGSSVGTLLFFSSWKENKLDSQHPVSKRDTQVKAEKKYMQYDDWLSGKFRSKSFYPRWISGSEYVYLADTKALLRKNIQTGEEVELLNDSAWKSVTGASSYSVSSDLEYVAIISEYTDGYAHYVRTFKVSVFDTATSTLQEIEGFPEKGIQKIKWDTVGHKMAYVYDFDVYVSTNFSESPNRLTTNGKENVMFNGITDWLYYVEITDDDALLWWSPNSKYLVFARINETSVKNFEFSFYGNTQYPTMVRFPYPKPGTPIPKTSIYVYNTEDFTSTEVEAKPSQAVLDWTDYYLNSATWRSDTIFSPTWKNRFENRSISESCTESSDWTCSHASVMESISTTGWLGNYKPALLVPLPGENEYLTVLSDSTGFPHLVVVNEDSDAKDWRTSGRFEVTDTSSGYSPIYFYDEPNDLIYFTSTELQGSTDGLPRIRHLWRVKGHGDDKTRTCITCDLNTKYENRCNWVTPSFSPDGSYVVVNCGGTGNGVPISILHNISSDGTITFVREVETNDELQQNLEEYYFRTREYGELNLPGDNENSYYYAIHKPPNFDPSKKYPMLVQVYSGPGYQYVVDAYNVDWARGYIASSDLDIVVMTFDGRGTGCRGDEIMHKIYRQLGKYEPEDQREAAKLVAKRYSFIDESRIAIWGRSYGGYATSRTIGEDAEQVFKCGFSVAPVTDWMTYHTIYTERYMGSPLNDNEDGYGSSSGIQKMENFGKHDFLLVHGTSDENVHFLNSARLSKALIEADVDFGAYFAGDETHSFNRASNAYGHHYKLLTNHLKTCFNL